MVQTIALFAPPWGRQRRPGFRRASTQIRNNPLAAVYYWVGAALCAVLAELVSVILGERNLGNATTRNQLTLVCT